jgi:hypothetical protein
MATFFEPVIPCVEASFKKCKNADVNYPHHNIICDFEKSKGRIL